MTDEMKSVRLNRTSKIFRFVWLFLLVQLGISLLNIASLTWFQFVSGSMQSFAFFIAVGIVLFAYFKWTGWFFVRKDPYNPSYMLHPKWTFWNRTIEATFYTQLDGSVAIDTPSETPKKQRSWKVNALWILGATLAMRLASGLWIACMQLLAKAPVITENDQSAKEMFQGQSTTTIVLLAIMTILIAPVIEELMYRLLFQTVLFYRAQKIGLVLVALLFGFAHVRSFADVNWVMYFILGLILGYVQYKTKDIRISMGVHMLSNFIVTGGWLWML